MKKVAAFIACICLSSIYMAAQDCIAFFPSNEGATWVTKTYNGSSQLLSTTTYRVNSDYEYMEGTDMQVGFMMTDNYNNVIDRGNIDASCVAGNFYVRMGNRAMSPEVMNMLGANTELVGNFLDYPDTFTTDNNGDLDMEAGNYTLSSRTNDETLIVRIYDRAHERNESITTPAGTFHTSRISFYFDCVKDGVTTTHWGIEWYAPGAGIVRSETYDQDDNLLNYTELTSLHN